MKAELKKFEDDLNNHNILRQLNLVVLMRAKSDTYIHVRFRIYFHYEEISANFVLNRKLCHVPIVAQPQLVLSHHNQLTPTEALA